MPPAPPAPLSYDTCVPRRGAAPNNMYMYMHMYMHMYDLHVYLPINMGC